MDYNLKIVMNGVEVLEDTGKTTMGGVTYDTPSITNVVLQNSASLGAMDIGATASDKLTFTMRNPYKQSFDGGVLEFWIAENPSGIESTLSKIADEVGTDTTTEGIDITQNTSNLIEDEEEGEALTEEELADVTEVQDVNEEDLFIQLEGEADTTQADETIETGWQQVGVYYVMGQTNNPDGSITITAYDGFCKLNGFYSPTTPTDTVQNLFNELRDKALEECGIVIDEYDFDDIADEVVTLNVLTTYRGALGFFAGLVGGFAEFDEDGTVCISFYSFSSNELIKSELLAYSEDSAGEMVLQELTCNTVVNGTEEITVGAGQGVSFTNPMMNESMLEKVLATYNGMRFVGGNISAIWDRSLMAGRFIRIFTEEEYANYLALLNQIEITTDEAELKGLKANANALGSIMLICSQVIDFRGNATTRITSGNGTEASKVNALTPPLIQKVMEAGKTATNFLSQDSTGALVVSNSVNSYNVRIDTDSVDIRDGEKVLASYGETIKMGSDVGGSFYGIEIDSGGVRLGLGGDVRLPNIESIRVYDTSSGAYLPIKGLAIASGTTSNGWRWVVNDDGTVDAVALDTYTPTSGNSNFVSGLYYKDTTKSYFSVIRAILDFQAEHEGALQPYDYFNLEPGCIQVDATTNGNSGAGYITVWKASVNYGNSEISTRLVSNSANNMGTVYIAYTMHITPIYDPFQWE